MYSPFALPSEVLVAALLAEFPGRQSQVRALCALVGPRCPAPRNIVLYGLAATGKSAVTTAVLAALASGADGEEDAEEAIAPAPRLRYAVVKSAECVTGRHLLERTVAAVAEAVGWAGGLGRCENLAQLGVLLGKMLEGRGEDRFVLVFDGVDAQRDAPPTLLPALARMGEVIPNLSTIFIVTSPRPHSLHNPGAPHIHFPSYTKPEALAILARSVPPIYPPTPTPPADDADISSDEAAAHLRPTAKETADLYTRFLSAVWDTFAKHSGRDLLSLRHLATTLWPRFTAPVRAGLYTAREFPKLLLAQRALFRDDALLVPSIVSPTLPSTTTTAPAPAPPPNANANASLPHTSRLLLTAAYLASHTPARLDPVLFSKSSAHAKKRRRGAGTPARKSRPGVERRRTISRKLLGPQAFVLERLLAIFRALAGEARGGKGGEGKVQGGGADVLAAVATLASLRLLVRTSAAADPLEGGGKWKVNVGWEVVRGVGRSVGVEVEEWVFE